MFESIAILDTVYITYTDCVFLVFECVYTVTLSE